MTLPASMKPAVPQERDDLLRDVMNRIGDKWSVIVICRLDQARSGSTRSGARRTASPSGC